MTGCQTCASFSPLQHRRDRGADLHHRHVSPGRRGRICVLAVAGEWRRPHPATNVHAVRSLLLTVASWCL